MQLSILFLQLLHLAEYTLYFNFQTQTFLTQECATRAIPVGCEEFAVFIPTGVAVLAELF